MVGWVVGGVSGDGCEHALQSEICFDAWKDGWAMPDFAYVYSVFETMKYVNDLKDDAERLAYTCPYWLGD